MPHLVSASPELLSSQLDLLQVEKDSVESKLRQATATISSLEAKNRILTGKVSKARGTWVKGSLVPSQ